MRLREPGFRKKVSEPSRIRASVRARSGSDRMKFARVQCSVFSEEGRGIGILDIWGAPASRRQCHASCGTPSLNGVIANAHLFRLQRTRDSMSEIGDPGKDTHPQSAAARSQQGRARWLARPFLSCTRDIDCECALFKNQSHQFNLWFLLRIQEKARLRRVGTTLM